MGKWKPNYKRKNNKKVIIVISIIVIIAFAMASDFGGIRTTIEEKSSWIKSNPSTSKGSILNDYCKENIIPETITFEYDFNQKEDSLSRLVSGWKDGTAIMSEKYEVISPLIWTGRPICRIGSSKGENTNYFYCENFIYRKTNIDNLGNIGETISYKVNLVLDKNSIITSKIDNFRNHASFEVVSSTCKSF